MWILPCVRNAQYNLSTILNYISTDLLVWLMYWWLQHHKTCNTGWCCWTSSFWIHRSSRPLSNHANTRFSRSRISRLVYVCTYDCCKNFLNHRLGIRFKCVIGNFLVISVTCNVITDELQDVNSNQFCGLFDRSSLRLGEVGRDSDNSIRDWGIWKQLRYKRAPKKGVSKNHKASLINGDVK